MAGTLAGYDGGNAGRLFGVAGRFGLVAAAVREPPEQDSGFGLVEPPALSLFCLVMPSAEAGEITHTPLLDVS